GQASRAYSESAEWERAVARGNAALDAVETAVRAWVASHPTVEKQPAGDPLAYGPTGIQCGCGKTAHSNLVPCQPEEQQGEEQAAELLALATVLEIPRADTGIPLQLRRSYGHADRWAICDREGRRWHRENGWVYEAQGIRDEAQRDGTRYTLAEAVPLARQLAEGAQR
ncbi:hypothetical protein, partial [Streptomyces sp. NPDC005568]